MKRRTFKKHVRRGKRAMLKAHARFLGRHDCWLIAIGAFGANLPPLWMMRQRLGLSRDCGGPSRKADRLTKARGVHETKMAALYDMRDAIADLKVAISAATQGYTNCQAVHGPAEITVTVKTV